MKESCHTICLFLVCCSVLQCVAVRCIKESYNVPLSGFAPFYSGMLQCFAVCCTKESCHTIRLFLVLRPSTLVCCSVLQCVAVCCSVLQCVVSRSRAYNPPLSDFAPFHSSVLKCLEVCCSVLQCVAVCCSVLQCVKSRSHVKQSVTF